MSITAQSTRRYFVRSTDLAHRLDLFLVAAIASVIGNRVFLVITGYPQVGNGTLHISHTIWGGLMMAIAIILATAYLSPTIRGVFPVLGGIGFGFFVDEVGKFITRDVNYFFKPAFSLIYLTFLTMFFVFRAIERKRFGPNEGVVNALEALKAAVVGKLDEPHRHDALDLLRASNADSELASRVAELLHEVPVLAPSEPSQMARAASRARDRYFRWTERPSFLGTVTALFMLWVVAFVGSVVVLVSDGGGVEGFSEWMCVVGETASTVLIIAGIVRLRSARLVAYRFFDAGLLVSLLFTQIFVFEQAQLAGTIDLGVTLIYWILLRSAIRAEQKHAAEQARA